jgi:hypothetical protein
MARKIYRYPKPSLSQKQWNRIARVFFLIVVFQCSFLAWSHRRASISEQKEASRAAAVKQAALQSEAVIRIDPLRAVDAEKEEKQLENAQIKEKLLNSNPEVANQLFESRLERRERNKLAAGQQLAKLLRDRALRGGQVGHFTKRSLGINGRELHRFSHSSVANLAHKFQAQLTSQFPGDEGDPYWSPLPFQGSESACKEWLEWKDGVPFSRDFHQEPIKVGRSDDRIWEDCSVGCHHTADESENDDAVFGLAIKPEGGAGAVSVLRSMEAISYYPRNNVTTAKKLGFQVFWSFPTLYLFNNLCNLVHSCIRVMRASLIIVIK